MLAKFTPWRLATQPRERLTGRPAPTFWGMFQNLSFFLVKKVSQKQIIITCLMWPFMAFLQSEATFGVFLTHFWKGKKTNTKNRFSKTTFVLFAPFGWQTSRDTVSPPSIQRWMNLNGMHWTKTGAPSAAQYLCIRMHTTTIKVYRACHDWHTYCTIEHALIFVPVSDVVSHPSLHF